MPSGKLHNPGRAGPFVRGWARAALVLSLVPALLGLGLLAFTSVGMAQTLFASFLAVLLGTQILGILGGQTRVEAGHERPSTAQATVVVPGGV